MSKRPARTPTGKEHWRAAGSAVAVMAVLLLATAAGLPSAGVAKAAAGPAYVLPDSQALPVMTALAARMPGTLAVGAGSPTTITPPGCTASPRPGRDQDYLSAMLGGPYIVATGGLGIPLNSNCLPAAVTGSFDAVPATLDTAPTAGVPAGIQLTPYSGPSVITVAGTVIDGADIRTGLDINAPNVTIRRSRISGTGFYGVQANAPGFNLTDTSVVGFDNGVIGDGYTATRVEVTGQNDDGFKVNTGVTITGSYCHDLAVGPESHSDCAQVQEGVQNVVLNGNWFDPVNPVANSALFIAPDLGPSTSGPVLIENNRFGGGNYALFCVDGNDGEYTIGNITIRGNRFLSDSRYGPVSINVPVSGSGNVMIDGSNPVSLK